MTMRLFDTVFKPLSKETPTNEVMATILHRTAFTLYTLFTVWGIIYICRSWSSMLESTGNPYVVYFGFFIAPVAACAAIGALYFPHLGRFEMFAASALITLIVAYLLFTSSDAFAGDIRAIHNLVLNCAHLVLPTAKVVYIYKTLIQRAERESQ